MSRPAKVTKIVPRKKPPGPRMVTKIVPKEKEGKQLDISFSCNECEMEFDNREQYRQHQEEFHEFEAEYSSEDLEMNSFEEDPENKDEESKQSYNEFEESDTFEDSEDNFSIRIKEEQGETEEIYEEIETLEETYEYEEAEESEQVQDHEMHFLEGMEEVEEVEEEDLDEPVSIKMESNDNVEIIYLSPDYFDKKGKPRPRPKDFKPRPREFKAEADPHRYILETSKVYSNRGKNSLDSKRNEVDRQLPCPHCSKIFADTSRLNKHIATHSVDRPFVCPVDGCGKRYKAPHHLKKHFYGHAIDFDRTSPFVCDFEGCFKVFGYACDLKVHKLTHEMKVNPSLKKFQCDVCSKRFAKSNHLQKHALIHIPDDQVQWLECPEGCGKKFRHIDNVNQHLASHGYEKYQYAKKRKEKQSEQYLIQDLALE